MINSWNGLYLNLIQTNSFQKYERVWEISFVNRVCEDIHF